MNDVTMFLLFWAATAWSTYLIILIAKNRKQ